MPDVLQSFPFVASPTATILILGSMPGERSLKERQYYAHPHNIFWNIMGDFFWASRHKAYKERLLMLKRCHIALWDVVFQCHRPGSLDADIKMESVIPNDFLSLFSHCPKINTVFFNGHKAEQLFRLPSTSPAHASLTKNQKKARWHRALKMSNPCISNP